MMLFSVALTLRFRNWARQVANESFTSGSSSYVDFGLPGTGKHGSACGGVGTLFYRNLYLW